MRMFHGVWFPDSEVHLLKSFATSPTVDGRGTHQYHKMLPAMTHVKKKRVAVDVGMHIGLWAMHLAKRFNHVVGFEPIEEHVECLRENMRSFNNYVLHKCALGDQSTSVGMKFLQGSTGSTHVDEKSTGVPMFRLDDFQFEHVDFLKIDVEGYEYQVVAGGEKIIRAHRPVVIVEQKPGKVEYYGRKQYDATRLLESWGAVKKFELQGDVCLSWN